MTARCPRCSTPVVPGIECVTCETLDSRERPFLEDAPKGSTMITVRVADGYEDLFSVLISALHQAQDGKGKERHANDLPFRDQPIIKIGAMVGMGFQTGQAIKKTVEAHGMVSRNELVAAHRELLGAINYLGAAALRLAEMSTAQTQEK